MVKESRKDGFNIGLGRALIAIKDAIGDHFSNHFRPCVAIAIAVLEVQIHHIGIVPNSKGILDHIAQLKSESIFQATRKCYRT